MTYRASVRAFLSSVVIGLGSASPHAAAAERTPQEVFQAVAPAVVVIKNSTSGEEKQGSGFVVEADGLIVTAFHVAAGADNFLMVKSFDGQWHMVAEVLGFDPEKDICVLKADAQHLPVLALGDSETLKPGQEVLVIGAPMGLEYTVVNGLFNGFRQLDGVPQLQFSAPSSPGNSGGPLLDLEGRVIGVITSGFSEGQNLNFATPISEVKRLLTTRQQMTLDQFKKEADRWSTEAKTRQAQVDHYETTLQQARAAELAGDAPAAIQGYEDALAICTKISDGGTCPRERIELLRVLTYFGSLSLKGGTFEHNNVLTAGGYGDRGVQLIEASGGVETLLSQMQSFGIPKEGLDGYRTNTFGLLYFYSGLGAIENGNSEKARTLLKTLRNIDPSCALLLEQAIDGTSGTSIQQQLR